MKNPLFFTFMAKGARNFAQKFYKSKSWKIKSQNYRQEHPFCERCLKKGLFVPAQLVHHRVHISKSNFNDMDILMGDDNLESLCRECHGAEHSKGPPKAKFNPDGSLML